MEMVRSVIPLVVEKRTLQKAIQTYGKNVLGKEGVTIQGLRRYCFVGIRQKKGIPLAEIKKLLGISSWSSMTQYT